MKPPLASAVAFLLLTASPVLAQNATWNLDPISNDWNTPANWTPQTVPDESTDVATFDLSNTTAISVATIFSLGAITFTPGASAYTFAISQGYVGYISFKGAGVINNSGVSQTFNCFGNVGFDGSATAGNLVIYINKTLNGPWISFNDSSDLGNATVMNKGHSPDFDGGYLVFTDHSSAADGTIINEQGDTYGGITRFEQFATAANSTITVELGATLQFEQSANGGMATLIASGGKIFFDDSSTGGLARVELTTGSTLDLIGHSNATTTAIGSLEGDNQSTLLLSRQQLNIGGNGLTTTFSGLISQNGSLVKTGNETLTLTGANTYRSGTTVSGGILQVNNATGSGTGTGAVKVNAGTLGGRGTIAGVVTIGTGSGSGAFLNPGSTRPDTLTLSKILTFKADGSYQCDLSLGQAKADQVSVNGVTIESVAQFIFLPKGVQMLARGTVFTVINNTAATPISGTFANLAEGSKLSTGAGNKLRVSYAGGDGNDLTLTVVQ